MKLMYSYYISAIILLSSSCCWLASLSLDLAFNKFENPRVALNNRLVASDDFLDLPDMTFDPVDELGHSGSCFGSSCGCDVEGAC